MPYAVGVTVDPVSAATLKDLAREVLEATDPEPCQIIKAPPHLTLAIADEVDVPGVRQLLVEIASYSTPIAISFASLGMFTTDERVVFLAPVVTEEMLAFHHSFHRRFDAIATGQSPLYLPDQWVPHCTIASGLSATALSRAIVPCLRFPLPFRARLTRIALATFHGNEVDSGPSSDEVVMVPLEGV